MHPFKTCVVVAYTHMALKRAKSLFGFAKLQTLTIIRSAHLITLPSFKPKLLKTPILGWLQSRSVANVGSRAKLENHKQGLRTNEQLELRSWQWKLFERDGIFKISRGPIAWSITLNLCHSYVRSQMAYSILSFCTVLPHWLVIILVAGFQTSLEDPHIENSTMMSHDMFLENLTSF